MRRTNKRFVPRIDQVERRILQSVLPMLQSPGGDVAIHHGFPRPIERGIHQGVYFPMPRDRSGDVANKIGAPGGNDSEWVDIDLRYARSIGPAVFGKP